MSTNSGSNSSSLNALLLAQNFSDYLGGYYHNDWVLAWQKVCNTRIYGPGYKGYSKKDTIHDVIRKTGQDPDLIILNSNWDDDAHPTNVDLHPNLGLDKVKIPKVMFINKEYKKLDQRLDFIRRNKIAVVCTLLRGRCKEWEEKTGVPFFWVPHGINLDLFKDLHLPHTHDLGFSGRVDIPIRLKIRDRLLQKRFLRKGYSPKEQYKDLKIVWREPEMGLLDHEEFLICMNKCKLFLSTKTKEDIVSERFLQLMATGTLVFSPEDDYDGILRDRINCVMFRNDLSDFDELLFYYVHNEDARQSITARASSELEQHTHENRLRGLVRYLRQSNLV